MGEIEEESATEKNQKRCECHIKSGARSRQRMGGVNLFGDLQKADCRNGHHACPHDNERKTYEVRDFWPGTESWRPAREGAAISRKRSNFSTKKPNAMTAMAVRTQARNVRSLAA